MKLLLNIYQVLSNLQTRRGFRRDGMEYAPYRFGRPWVTGVGGQLALIRGTNPWDKNRDIKRNRIMLTYAIVNEFSERHFTKDEKIPSKIQFY